MKVICKKNGIDEFYSQLVPGKSYDLAGTTISKYVRIYFNCDNIKCKGNCKVGLFLKEYFYTKEELRDNKLIEIGI